MKLVITYKELTAALNAVSFAVSRKSTLPILAHVKIEAFAPGTVVFSVTNLEVYATYKAAAWVIEEGATTTNHKELLALVKPLKGQEFTLTLENTGLTVSTGSLTVALDVEKAEDFPACPRSAENDAWTIGDVTYKRILDHQHVLFPVDQFRKAVDLVAGAAAADDSRPVLTCTLLELKNDTLTLAAADAFSLSVQETYLAGAGSWDYAPLVPAKSLQAAVKKFSKAGDLTITSTSGVVRKFYANGTDSDDTAPGFVSFFDGKLVVDIRTVDGQFPNFRNIIPTEESTRATVPASALQQALKVVEPIAKDSSNITNWHVNGAIQLHAQRDGMEKPLVLDVPAETSGNDLDIILNCRYLLDILARGPKAIHTFAFTSPRKPVKITAAALPGYTAVLMPMHVNK